MMKRKTAALLTALAVLAGVCAPVCAESPEPVLVEFVYDEAYEDDAHGEDEAADISDGYAAEEYEDDVPDETSADETSADEDASEDNVPAAVQDTDAADISSEDELVSDEAEYSRVSWGEYDASTSTLTLRGQLCNTYYDDDKKDYYNLCRIAGINEEQVRKVVIEKGTLAGTSTKYMFCNMRNLEEIQGLQNLDMSIVTDMACMFGNCESLTALSFSGWDTRSATNMSGMFLYCDKLRFLDLRDFDTSNVTKMEKMFHLCTDLDTVIVSGKWNTSAVTKSDAMFDGCDCIRGGAGTVYSEAHIDKEYACLDRGASRPGYFTDISAISAPAKPTVVIKPVFGGRTVQFLCDDKNAEIYYNFGSSNITLSCASVRAGETIFVDEPMTGNKAALYFKAYNGRWSPVGKWGVLNVQLDKPKIKKISDNKVRIYTQAKNSYIVYSLSDGPDSYYPYIAEGKQKLTVKHGTIVWGTDVTVTVKKGQILHAIAIRSGLVTSDVMTYTNN